MRKAKVSAPKAEAPRVETVTPAPVYEETPATGLCRDCKFWRMNNKLAGHWVGVCVMDHGITAEHYTCADWKAKP